MKETSKDFRHAKSGMNSDVETVEMLHREAANILKAEEIHEGESFRITMITGEERIINGDELKYLRGLCLDSVTNDFDIYYLNGEITTAI